MIDRDEINLPLDEEVNKAFQLTTIEQRRTVSTNWRMRHPYAALLHLSPDALLIASLLDNEHPAICTPRGYPVTTDYQKMLKKIYAYSSVDKPLETVDNVWKEGG
jgi:hypothetical protein